MKDTQQSSKGRHIMKELKSHRILRKKVAWLLTTIERN